LALLGSGAVANAGSRLAAQVLTRDSTLLAAATAVAARATPEAYREAIVLRREAATIARARGDRQREATALARIRRCRSGRTWSS
jgi:hypothetical protein